MTDGTMLDGILDALEIPCDKCSFHSKLKTLAAGLGIQTEGRLLGDVLDDIAAKQGIARDSRLYGEFIRKLYDWVTSGEDVTLTGNPLVLEDALPRPLKSCVVSWEPKQAGTGNPYPAGGGPNLLDISGMRKTTDKGVTFELKNGGIWVHGTATAQSKSPTFSLSGLQPGTYAGITIAGILQQFVVKKSGASGNVWLSFNNTPITVSDGDEPQYYYFVVESGKTINSIVYPMVCKSSTWQTVYAPYENIRPISGWDTVSVELCRENLLDTSQIAENKGVTLDGTTIHVVDTSGWGSSYIIFLQKYPAGTYTIQITADEVPHGKFILRGYDAVRNVINSSILPRMEGFESSYNQYYNATLLYAYKPTDKKKTITFTVQNAVYFQVGVTAGLESGEVIADMQELVLVPGTIPSINYKPYTGQSIALTLQKTMYGSEVDVQTGEGLENWKLVTFDGTEKWVSWGVDFRVKDHTGFYLYAINDYSVPDADKSVSSHYSFSYGTYGGATLGFGLAESNSRYCIIAVNNSILADTSSTNTAVASFKAYLAAQYAAGTPVQIAYKLAEPVPFTATGGGKITALAGTNTLLTDADSITATYRCSVKPAEIELDGQP